MRVDFNVPIENNAVQDNSRIRAALDTITYLIDQNAKVILLTHLGRPKSEANARYRVDPIAFELQNLLGKPVHKLNNTIGIDIENHISDEMSGGDVVLLENVRFYKGEKDNDPEFGNALARLADAYINDAFGTSHRAHASTTGVTAHLPSAAGLLLSKEIRILDQFLAQPQSPYWAIIGGAKLTDKIGVIKNLIDKIDGLIIGGGAAFTFLKANGHSIGRSLVDESMLKILPGLLQDISDNGVELILPTDLVAASELSPTTEAYVVPAAEIPDDLMGLDIGPDSIDLFASKLRSARSLLWAGPLGAFEVPPFHNGSFKVSQVLSELPNADILIGGGDTTSCFNESGTLAGANIHFSTGGGAMLEYISGNTLPAIEALKA